MHCLTTLPSHCSKSFLMGSVQASRCSSERWSTIPRWATNASNSSIQKLQHGGTDQLVNLKNIKIQIQIQTQIQIKKVQLPRLLGGKKEALQKRGGEGIWLHWMVGEKEGRQSGISWPTCALFSLMLLMMMMCCYCYTSFTPPAPFSLCSCRNIARPFLLLNHCIMG